MTDTTPAAGEVRPEADEGTEILTEAGDGPPEGTDEGSSEAGGGPPEGAGVPWITPEIQQRIEWRDGDIVVAVPPKSGTTWTMNIVHQLRSGGDDEFADVYVEVPWLELLPSPESTVDDVVARIDAMTDERRRAFKTHSAPPELPYQEPGGTDVRYVVVMRNPDEALASFHPFLLGHSEAFFEMWGVPKAAIATDLATFFAELGGAMLEGLFSFVAAWWPRRNAENVLFVHYADLTARPEAEIRRISRFLGLEVPEERWPAVLEYTSFSWMKANEHRFELRGVSVGVPILEPGAMLRRGRTGSSAEDGVTPEMSDAIADMGRSIVEADAALRWLYAGGPLPG